MRRIALAGSLAMVALSTAAASGYAFNGGGGMPGAAVHTGSPVMTYSGTHNSGFRGGTWTTPAASASRPLVQTPRAGGLMVPPQPVVTGQHGWFQNGGSFHGNGNAFAFGHFNGDSSHGNGNAFAFGHFNGARPASQFGSGPPGMRPPFVAHDIRSDRADLRADVRDLRADIRDVNRDRVDLVHDLHQLRTDQRLGITPPAALLRDIASDRADIRADIRDIRADHFDVKADRRDLSIDRRNNPGGSDLPRRDFRDDRSDFHTASRDFRGDRFDGGHEHGLSLSRDLRNDRADLRSDIRDVRRDRIDVARDRVDLNHDLSQLRAILRSGGTPPDWLIKDIASDRVDIRADLRDIAADRKDIARDARDIAMDRASFER